MEDHVEDHLRELARKRRQEHGEFKQKYTERIEQVLGPDKQTNLPKKIIAMKEMGKNVRRLIKDDWFRVKNVKGLIKNRDFSLKVSVMKRDSVFVDPRLVDLWNIGKNKIIFCTFAREELHKEILFSHWLMIEGLSVAEFHALVKKMGHNPRTFLSGDRGENDGRVAIDNEPTNGELPFMDRKNPIFEQEIKYWSRVFPKASLRLPWGDWSMSRTHGVVYFVKNAQGKDIILFPVHVDTKNAVAAFRRTEKGEREALHYHQIAQGNSNYVGTGLYDLGCKYFIYLLKKAKDKGLITGLEIEGEDLLETSGSIVMDDKMSLMLESS